MRVCAGAAEEFLSVSVVHLLVVPFVWRQIAAAQKSLFYSPFKARKVDFYDSKITHRSQRANPRDFRHYIYVIKADVCNRFGPVFSPPLPVEHRQGGGERKAPLYIIP